MRANKMFMQNLAKYVLFWAIIAISTSVVLQTIIFLIKRIIG
jgi:hypothetical protein